jgi:G patch domain-containing protein 1
MSCSPLIISGWAPQQFKSSRSNRAAHVQRADDFMDEEDRMQMKEDRQLENTDTFRADQFAGTREGIQGQR